MKPEDTRITYGRSEDAWHGYTQYIIDQIQSCDAKNICDIGGGANPLLDTDTVNELDINYMILDISDEELDKAPDDYKKIKADISEEEIPLETSFDLMFSKMLAEHVEDTEQFHKNIFKLLKPGGIAIHFFPTLYALPFVVNKLLPENFTDKLLRVFSPRNMYRYAKFPAYYNWCRGPSKYQIQKYRDYGFEVIEYRGFYGHSSYYNRFKLIQRLHEMTTHFLMKYPNPFFTSYAYVVLKKSNN